MNLLPLVTLVISAPVGAGFITSREQSRWDRSHRAALIGFSGAVVSVAATILWLWAAHTHSTPAWQGLVFVAGIVGIVSSLVSLVAGIFSGGIQRWTLIGVGIVMGLIYLLGAFSNFGA